jgi:preprotein translocase subunit SecG|tara:strand:- start:161 stop:547 length:387 start_codon:yes stop_codon:yes gene_type:complete
MNLEIVETLVLVVHVLAALSITGLVLIQHGKGADMGSGFGGGASSTVFGSGGAGNFLSRATTMIAIAFFVTSFGLAFFAKEKSITMRNMGMPDVIQQAPAQAEMPDQQTNGGSEFPELDPVDSEIPDS